MDIGRTALRLFGIEHYEGNLENIQPNTWHFFEQAQSSIQIVAGELTSDFYSHPDTLQTLEEVIKRGVLVNIVSGPDIDQDSARALLEKGARLYKLERRPRVHFAVVDGKHAKVEEPHPPKQKDRVYYIKEDTYSLARELEAKFEDLMKDARPLTREQL